MNQYAIELSSQALYMYTPMKNTEFNKRYATFEPSIEPIMGFCMTDLQDNKTWVNSQVFTVYYMPIPYVSLNMYAQFEPNIVVGPQGPTGSQGVQGVQGPSGTIEILDTVTLDAGSNATVTNSGSVENALLTFGIPTGPRGPQGIQGIEGPMGLTGPQGVQGTQGAQGIQGFVGPQGSAGVGTLILGSYNSLPELELAHPTGSAGESYIVQGYLYVWDSINQTWYSAGLVQGPQGLEGPAGTNGLQGTQGIQGETGPQGIQGIQGETGTQGEIGLQGLPGPTGSQGATGPIGATGPAGSDVSPLACYPVGAIYISVNSTSPAILFGGTWAALSEKFLLASGSTHAPGVTGGASTIALTTSQMPVHTHTQKSHTHTQYSHGHTFSGSSHYHGLNNHKHSFSDTSSSAGAHTHKQNSKTWMNDSGHYDTRPSGTKGYYMGASLASYYTASSGAHTHYVSGTTGGNSGNTTSKTQGGSNSTTTAKNYSTTATNNNAGSGSAHSNMPPYLTVYMWKRTA